MTKERKNEIKEKLLSIYDNIENPTMFNIMVTFLIEDGNKERINGKWVRENIEELTDLPS